MYPVASAPEIGCFFHFRVKSNVLSPAKAPVRIPARPDFHQTAELAAPMAEGKMAVFQNLQGYKLILLAKIHALMYLFHFGELFK